MAGDVDGDGAALYDAVVVVAGGIEDDGTLPAWVVSRLDFAAAEYARHAAARPDATPPTYVVLSGSATPHKPPPVARGGFTYHESTAMAEYLMRRWDVPAAALLKDTASMDTIGNAYFSLTLHAAPREWRAVRVVTSRFHMGRTRAAFEWVFGLSGGGQDEGGGAPKIELAFHATPDDGLSPEVVKARAEREAASEAALRNRARRDAARVRGVAVHHAHVLRRGQAARNRRVRGDEERPGAQVVLMRRMIELSYV